MKPSPWSFHPLSVQLSFRRVAHRVGFLLAAASLCLSPLAHAGGRAKPRPPFQAPYDKIDAVDATAKTITISHVNSTDHGSRTFHITDLTEIEVNGGKGAIADLKAGMRVSVSIAMDPTLAERITAKEDTTSGSTTGH